MKRFSYCLFLFIILFVMVSICIFFFMEPLQAKVLRYASSVEAFEPIGEANHSVEDDLEVCFEVNEDYLSIQKIKDGQKSFDLGQLLANNGGFNSGARFVVGDADNPVFTVTNNSKTNIKVGLEDVISEGSIVLLGRGTGILEPGETAGFNFEINTTGVEAGTISAVIQIKK